MDNTQALILSGDILLPWKCASVFKSHTHLAFLIL